MSLKIGKGFELPVDVLTEAIGIVATRGAGKTYASVVLIEEAANAGVPFVVIDATSVYHGLRSSANGEKDGLPVYVFGGKHGDLPLEPEAGALMADVVVETGHSFVLDVSDFRRGIARRFVSDFLTRLYERKARERSALLLVIDEADEWAPQKPNRDSAFSLSAMELIVKRGRSRGLGAVLITQRTQALNKDVLDLIETLFAMRQLAERSRDAVKGWIADKEMRDELGVIDSLPSLPTGTAWVWSPVRGILERVEIRRITTFDSYGSVSPSGPLPPEPKRRVELDLEALGEQMATTVKRAKDNDPKALRARVAELERQLATRVAEPTEVIVEVPVEIPVEVLAIKPEQIAALREWGLAARDAVEPLLEALKNLGSAGRAVTERAGPVNRGPQVPSRPSVAESRQRTPSSRVSADVQASRSVTASSNGSLTGPEQRVLDAIRWYGVLGNERPNKAQVGFIAGYRVSKSVGGTFGNILGKLRTAGYLEYPGPGLVELTEAGHALANDPDIAPDDQGIQDAVMARLNGPEQRVLGVLINHWPNGLRKQELGELSGYTVGPSIGGTFGNILGRLRSLGVIEYPSPGDAVATDVLFPVASR